MRSPPQTCIPLPPLKTPFERRPSLQRDTANVPVALRGGDKFFCEGSLQFPLPVRERKPEGQVRDLAGNGDVSCSGQDSRSREQGHGPAPRAGRPRTPSFLRRTQRPDRFPQGARGATRPGASAPRPRSRPERHARIRRRERTQRLPSGARGATRPAASAAPRRSATSAREAQTEA
jgi:hypothetical protein